MSSLSEEDRQRIRAEEIYREEVRAALAERGGRESWLAFFNSALGIWLLSTLVLGLGSWAYATYVEKLEEGREQAATLARLDTEMQARIRTLATDHERMQDWAQARRAVQRFRAEPRVFPEYANWSTEGLLWAMRGLSPAQTAVIDRALVFLEQLDDAERDWGSAEDFAPAQNLIARGLGDELRPWRPSKPVGAAAEQAGYGHD